MGDVLINNTPEIFESYLTKLIQKSIVQKNEFVFINAWNEWGEGNYVEPDCKFGKGFLDVIRNVLYLY